MTNNYVGEDDLIYNTSARLPVCLCLDISGSMQKNDAISQLNSGVKAFYEAIKNDDQAKSSCEIAVVTFNSTVNVVEDFGNVETKAEPNFFADGGTALAHGVEKALEILDVRKNDYKNNGIEYYQPWLVIITDGKPGDMEDLPALQLKVVDLVADKKLSVWPIAVGSDDDSAKFHAIMDVLNGFCLPEKKKALHLKDLKFNEFFEWLGKSVSTVSQSKVGEQVKLDTSGMDSWGEI